jgi:hypothetical protein
VSDHKETAAAAVGIVDRLERQGFSPKRKAEILSLVSNMINIELLRESAATASVPQPPPPKDE